MKYRNQIAHYSWYLAIFLLLVSSGCQINDYDSDWDSAYQESFLFTRSVAGKSEVYLTNVNGTITVIGVDTLNEARISGTKIVKDQTEDAARQHIVDLSVDVQESGSTLYVKTIQPSTSGRRSYQVNYELMIPSAWKVTANNVNGNVGVQNIHNTVSTTVVNGVVNTTDISGSVNAAVTNGTIGGKVFLPENGSCILSLVNGNVSLLVPRTTSATVSAAVTLGTVSVSNLPMTYTTNTPVVVTGVLGGGKGTIRLSSVTGVVQLVGM